MYAIKTHSLAGLEQTLDKNRSSPILDACRIVSHNVHDLVLRAGTRVAFGARGDLVPLLICQLRPLAACCGFKRRAYTKLEGGRGFSGCQLYYQFNQRAVAFNVDASTGVRANGNEVIC